MVIKRVDVEEDISKEVGWSWRGYQGGIETLTVIGRNLGFESEMRDEIYIDKSEIKHWIKALTEAQKYFDAQDEEEI